MERFNAMSGCFIGVPGVRRHQQMLALVGDVTSSAGRRARGFAKQTSVWNIGSTL